MTELEYWKLRAVVHAEWLSQVLGGEEPKGIRRWRMEYESKRTIKEIDYDTPHLDVGFWQDCIIVGLDHGVEEAKAKAQMDTYKWVMENDG